MNILKYQKATRPTPTRSPTGPVPPVTMVINWTHTVTDLPVLNG